MAPVTVDISTSTRIINPLEVKDWDDRVRQLPGATFFHTSEWARVLSETYGFRPAYFATENAQGIVAVLPMMEVDSWLTGRRGVSLPFTDDCRPLCADDRSFHTLFDAAREHGRERSWKYIELRGGKEFLPDAPTATRFFNHQLSLQSDKTVVFGQFADSVRRAIRKAEKSDLAIEFACDRESIRAFYQLLCLTRKRHGVPPQPFRFFEAVQERILANGRGWVVLARHHGIPVAGAVYFHAGKAALYKYGASDDTQQHLRANNFVMARAIEWYAQNGFTFFDFGRTSLHNEGLRNFKLGWGTTESHIEYVRIATRTGNFLTAPDKTGNLSQRVFNLLPIPLSRLIGAALYRHVA